MTETEVQLKRIQTKLQQLLKQYSVLQKENGWLKDELDSAKKEVSSQRENIDNLKQQVNVLKFSNGEMGETDKKEFEKKINNYVREIDRCIATCWVADYILFTRLMRYISGSSSPCDNSIVYLP
jgi:chromosome segregation ATPase